MIATRIRRHGLNYYDVWYAEKEWHRPGIVEYKSALTPLGGDFHVKKTLVTSLAETEEDICAHFSKNCRYEMRRAEREGVSVSIKTSNEITKEDIDEFVNYFVAFCESKGLVIPDKGNMHRSLEEYNRQGALIISNAAWEERVLVYHTYIVDQVRARLFQSASLFRVEENIPKSLIGMANRYLHKMDILYLKKMGKEEYDWGGAGESDEVASITEFKRSFGGREVELYDSKCYYGIGANIYRLCSLLKR